ncbi:MAG: ROK family protein [Eubacterium sp.]|nr:ROK family protein [Eubacterium sp.]
MELGKYLIGVDVGGTTSKIAVFDSENISEILVKTAVPARTESGGVHILPDIAEAVSVLTEELGIGMDDIAGIGIGVPGPVVRDKETGGSYVNKCVNLNWGIKDVAGELSELTGVSRVAVLNDANAAALGEVICGTSKEIAETRGTYDDMTAVVVTLGTGIGGGIVKDGEIIQGAFGSAGEIGHMKICPQHPLLGEINACCSRDEPDESGTYASAESGADGAAESGADVADEAVRSFNDLEYYASATGIARMARATLATLSDESSLRVLVKSKGNGAEGDYSAVDAKAVFDAAKAGDELALKVVDFFAETLGTGLAAVSSVIDPDVFIIGGGVAGAGDFLLTRVEKYYRETVFHASHNTGFRLAVLGNDAGMIGAACALL